MIATVCHQMARDTVGRRLLCYLSLIPTNFSRISTGTACPPPSLRYRQDSSIIVYRACFSAYIFQNSLHKLPSQHLFDNTCTNVFRDRNPPPYLVANYRLRQSHHHFLISVRFVPGTRLIERQRFPRSHQPHRRFPPEPPQI